MTVGETAEIRMAKRKQRARNVRRAPAAGQAKAASEPTPEDQISYSALSLHALFEQQTRQLLDRADLDEEQKQNILVAMSCPCCGAGAMSFTAKLKR
jgi:3-oxoacyl-ACP reductase-like protein